MQTHEERVTVGPYTLVVERPAEPDALLDERRFADDEFLPYWAELWPSGLALAEHLARVDVDGKRVLELGCGLGLPSITAALGGARVLATDWAPEALALLARNAARNGAVLQTRVADWRAPGTISPAGFDLVCAADVLYEARYVEPLRELVAAAARAGCTVLVADPGRRHAAGFVGSLPATLEVRHVHSALIPRGGITVVRG